MWLCLLQLAVVTKMKLNKPEKRKYREDNVPVQGSPPLQSSAPHQSPEKSLLLGRSYFKTYFITGSTARLVQLGIVPSTVDGSILEKINQIYQ